MVERIAFTQSPRWRLSFSEWAWVLGSATPMRMQGAPLVRWVGERECSRGCRPGPPHRWRPHPSTPLLRRRALTRLLLTSANRRPMEPRETGAHDDDSAVNAEHETRRDTTI